MNADTVVDQDMSQAAGYEIYEPGEVDRAILDPILKEFKLTPESPVLMLPYGRRGGVGFEIRKLYFAPALNGANGALGSDATVSAIPVQSLPVTRIISFGDCNVACGYCKRDMQFIDEDGVPTASTKVPVLDVARLAEGAVRRGEIPRFSGGDPVMFPSVTLALAKYIDARYGEKVSIAHNGSGTKWVERLVPYLSSAAIDLKAVPEKIGSIMGIDPKKGQSMYDRSLATQRVVSSNGILLDVRTPIFGDTIVSDMERLAESIVRVNDLRYTFWTWRMYKPVAGCEYPVPTMDMVIDMMQKVSAQHSQLWMGMRAKWDRGGMLFMRGGKIISTTSDVEVKVQDEFGSGNRVDVNARDTLAQLAA